MGISLVWDAEPLNDKNESYVKSVQETETTKFLGLQIDSHLKWKSSIDQVNSKTQHAL